MTMFEVENDCVKINPKIERNTIAVFGFRALLLFRS